MTTSKSELVDAPTAWNGDVVARSTDSSTRDMASTWMHCPYYMSYAKDGTDWKFQMPPNRPDTNLWIMAPTNTDRRDHITAQYSDQIDTFDFDGIHIDQLGNWGDGASHGGMTDATGNPVHIPIGFRDLVADTREQTGQGLATQVQIPATSRK